jgi:hypothetical protein
MKKLSTMCMWCALSVSTVGNCLGTRLDERLGEAFSALQHLIESEQVENEQVVRVVRNLLVELSKPGSFGPRYEYLVKTRRQVQELTQGFDAERSPAWQGLGARFGADLSLPNLLSIADLLKGCYGDTLTKLTRTHRRNKGPLVRWFDENWFFIQTVLPTIELRSSDGQAVAPPVDQRIHWGAGSRRRLTAAFVGDPVVAPAESEDDPWDMSIPSWALPWPNIWSA